MRALSRVGEGAAVLLLRRGGAVDWAVAVGIAVGVVLVFWAVLALLARRLPPGLARELAAFLPACVGLARTLRLDPAVPRRAKLALSFGVVWLVSPIDLVPEFLPVIGPIDDVVVIALVLRYAARRIPVERLVEAWPGDDPRLLLRLTGRRPARSTSPDVRAITKRPPDRPPGGRIPGDGRRFRAYSSPMALPVLLAVEDDPRALRDVERELTERYANHYQVVCLRSPGAARPRLAELAASGVDVALVLAAQSLPGTTGSELLDGVRRIHPHARRALMVEWGDWGQKPTGRAIFEGIARGRFEHYMLRPAGSPDELFHQTISAMLLDWAEARQAGPYTIHVVAESWDGRGYELREALRQCAMSHDFCLADSDEGRTIIASVGSRSDLPLMVFPNGRVLENPSNFEIALASGSPVDPQRERYDIVVVGAGPAGLSAAVYGASEGLSTLVVDRGGIGGQATSSSLIRNYLGFPSGVSGRQLARAAYDQAWVFGAEFAFMQSVTGLEREGDDLVVMLSEGVRLLTTAVLLAMGVSYRRLGVPSLEQLVGAGVYYGGTSSEAPALAGRDVVVVGGANSAGQSALHISRYARRVVLVVRGPSLRAGMSEYLVRQVEATANIEVRLSTEVVGGGGHGRLEHVTLRDAAAGTDETLEARALFVLIGAQPHTDWLGSEIERDEQGFVLTGDDISRSTWKPDRDPFDLETSMPGVFAGGDIRHGSVKRVASAVGEGSITVQHVHRLLAAS